MNMSARIVLAVAVALCFASVGANGQQRAPGSGITCSIDSVPYLPFGYYDPFQANDLMVQNHFSFQCEPRNRQFARPQSSTRATRGRDQTVQISISTGLSGTFDRRMRGIFGDLVYNIYLDPAGTDVWGDGSRGTDVYSKKVPTDQASAEIVPVFGRMPAGQSVHAGPYFDLLVVTIEF